jgi:hypothetical protein
MQLQFSESIKHKVILSLNMGVRRSGIVGTTLAVVLLGSFLHRLGGSSGPAPTAESNQGALPGNTEQAKKGKKKSISSTKGRKTGVEAGDRDHGEKKGPWIALQEHFAGRPEYRSGMKDANSKSDTSVPMPDCSALTGENAFQPGCIPGPGKVKALIAVVPDPVHTHMALRFDRAIDAIELAAGSMNYLIGRYWLPWDLEAKRDWDDYESLQEAEGERKLKEAEPGLLIFRREAKAEAKPEAETTMLAVFLVGETSTAGINGDQFVNAVCYADRLNQGNGTDLPYGEAKVLSPDTLGPDTYILGPTSSASFASLAGLIESGRYRKNKFVVNATARNSLALQAMTEDLHLSPFVRSVPQATQQLRRMLASNGYISEPCPEKEKHEVAILSEGSTALGGSFDVAYDEPKDVIESNRCVDIFKYPREIASLRNAYSASNGQNTAAGEQSAGPRPSLAVNLTETSNESDEPRDFSKAQSPFSQEAALMDMAAEMQRSHYRYIGINGSNPLDVVFLAGYLRSAVPNARLFSFDSDLLLQHEPDNASYIGTLSVTTYPLLYRPLNEIGEPRTPERNARLPFTSQREEAIYNAAVCLVRKMLGDDHLGYLSERDVCPPAPNERKASSEAPNPPLWLTVFGAGGHWPVQVLGPAEDKTLGPNLEDAPLPSAWKATCTLLCALAVLHVLLLLGLAPFSPKFQAFKLTTVTPARQLVGIHMASATLALATTLVALSAWRPNVWTRAAELLVWILPGTSWVLTYKYFRWWRADKTKAEEPYLHTSLSPSGMAWQFVAFAGIWTAAGILAYVWCTLRDDTGGHYGAFFSVRAVNLASIVSPLMPLLTLLTAIYIGAIFYVWHLVFDDQIRPRLNPRDEESAPVEKLRPGRRSEKRIASAVNEDGKSAIVGGAILALWFMVFYQPQFELFERPGFKTLFETLFGLVILLILVSGYRLARIWRELRRFLLEVNRLRVRGVLLQLKSEGLSWSSIWFYGSEDPDWDYMVRSLNVLQELWNTPGQPPGSKAIDEQMKVIRSERKSLQNERLRAFHPFGISENDGKLENAISQAQDLFARTLNEVLDHLSAIWANPASSDKGIERQKLLEKYVALRWVAFIRGVIGRIRLLIIFLAVAFSLAMISLVIYSFEPHRELLWSVTALFITIGLAIMKVLIQMHRDDTLSYITATKPGRLDFAFFFHLVTLGVGPLVTLLATHFPGIGRYVISFLQPGLEALK